MGISFHLSKGGGTHAHLSRGTPPKEISSRATHAHLSGDTPKWGTSFHLSKGGPLATSPNAEPRLPPPKGISPTRTLFCLSRWDPLASLRGTSPNGGAPSTSSWGPPPKRFSTGGTCIHFSKQILLHEGSSPTSSNRGPPPKTPLLHLQRRYLKMGRSFLTLQERTFQWGTPL